MAQVSPRNRWPFALHVADTFVHPLIAHISAHTAVVTIVTIAVVASALALVCLSASDMMMVIAMMMVVV